MTSSGRRGVLSSGADAHRLGVAVPQLHGQELPDLLGPVLAAGLLMADELEQRLAADYAGVDELAAHQDVVDELAKVAADPGAQRGAEGGLRPVHDLVGQPVLCRLLERELY